MKGAGPGTLFVVATPIGNLEDITLRALRVLREVAIIAAEDTRRTGNLLRHYQIRTPVVSLHKHNERARLPKILDRLRRGESVALVTDAGTPGISDPGQLLVQQVRQAAVPVTAVPGPSAVTAALSISGLRDNRFVFAGFPPIKSKDRKLWLEWLSTLDGLPAIFFEAPHRLDRTLSDLHLYLGERPISVARELTKLHEEWVTGAIPAISGALTTRKGEFVVLVHPSRKADDAPVEASDERVALVFGEMTQDARSRREAIHRTADRLGMPARDVFAALERARRSPE